MTSKSHVSPASTSQGKPLTGSHSLKPRSLPQLEGKSPPVPPLPPGVEVSPASPAPPVVELVPPSVAPPVVDSAPPSPPLTATPPVVAGRPPVVGREPPVVAGAPASAAPPV